MSKEALLDFYAPERRKTLFHEAGNGKAVAEMKQDCEPIVEWVAQRRDVPQDRELRHIAEIPLTVLNQAMTDGWLDDPKAWRRWANDPDNRAFRVWEGRW